MIDSEGLGIFLLVLSLACLGTWPALLRLCSTEDDDDNNSYYEPGGYWVSSSPSHESSPVLVSANGLRNICHVYLDYAAAYFFASCFPLLVAAIVSQKTRDTDGDNDDDGTGFTFGFSLFMEEEKTISSAPLALVAMLGGSLLSMGNLSIQWATSVFEAPLTTVLAIQASLTVVLGAGLNYRLEPYHTPRPGLLCMGVATFLVAIALATRAQLIYGRKKQEWQREEQEQADDEQQQQEQEFNCTSFSSMDGPLVKDILTGMEVLYHEYGGTGKQQQQEQEDVTMTGRYHSATAAAAVAPADPTSYCNDSGDAIADIATSLSTSSSFAAQAIQDAVSSCYSSTKESVFRQMNDKNNLRKGPPMQKTISLLAKAASSDGSIISSPTFASSFALDEDEGCSPSSHNNNKGGPGAASEGGEEERPYFPFKSKLFRLTKLQWGVAIAVFGGLCFGFYSPAFNIAVNDPFSWSQVNVHRDYRKETLQVALGNLWFSLSFWLSSLIGNTCLLAWQRHSQHGTAFSCALLWDVLKAYWREHSFWDRQVALMAGLLCAIGNILQFQGGEMVGYATADLVQAYPLVSTIWDVLLFDEFRQIQIYSKFALLLACMYAAYLTGIVLVAFSSVPR